MFLAVFTKKRRFSSSTTIVESEIQSLPQDEDQDQFQSQSHLEDENEEDNLNLDSQQTPNPNPTTRSRPHSERIKSIFFKSKAKVDSVSLRFRRQTQTGVVAHDESDNISPPSLSRIASPQSPNHHSPISASNGIEVDFVEALQSVHQALHDPSVLDVYRHKRNGLDSVLLKPSTRNSKSGTGRLNSVLAGLPDLLPITPFFNVNLYVPNTNTRNDKKKKKDRLVPTIAVNVVETQHVEISESPLELGPPARSGSDGTSPTLALQSTRRRRRRMKTSDLKFLRFLGEGTNGQVCLAVDKVSKTTRVMAVKAIFKRGRVNKQLSVVERERDVHAKLGDSPWFVKMLASWHDRRQFYIAMEVYPTDIDSELLKYGSIEPERAKFYMAEIIIALTHLHKLGIIHNDLKASNVLISSSGHIVLADFGLSHDFHKIPTIAERIYQPFWPFLPEDNPECGTPRREVGELHFVSCEYRGSALEMAPEVHMGRPHSFGVDFWSAGVVLFWMLTGRPPFYEPHNEDATPSQVRIERQRLVEQILEDDLEWLPTDKVDDAAKDFLESMLRKNPARRLMIELEIPDHPYFAGVNWLLMERRLVPPPWIPRKDILHQYTPTKPLFTPGEDYDAANDPYPEFHYVSPVLEDAFEGEEGGEGGGERGGGGGRGRGGEDAMVKNDYDPRTSATSLDSGYNSIEAHPNLSKTQSRRPLSSGSGSGSWTLDLPPSPPHTTGATSPRRFRRLAPLALAPTIYRPSLSRSLTDDSEGSIGFDEPRESNASGVHVHPFRYASSTNVDTIYESDWETKELWNTTSHSHHDQSQVSPSSLAAGGVATVPRFGVALYGAGHWGGPPCGDLGQGQGQGDGDGLGKTWLVNGAQDMDMGKSYLNSADIEIHVSAASASASSSSSSALAHSYGSGSASASASVPERQLRNDADYFSYSHTILESSHHVDLDDIDGQTRYYPRPSTPIPPDSSETDLTNVAQAQAQVENPVPTSGGDQYQYAQYAQIVNVGPSTPDTPSRLPTPGPRPRLIGPRPPRARSRYSAHMDLPQIYRAPRETMWTKMHHWVADVWDRSRRG